MSQNTYKKISAIDITEDLVTQDTFGNDAIRVEGTLATLPADTPSSAIIVNIAVPTANTEQSFTFPDSTKRFLFKLKESDTGFLIRYATGGPDISFSKSSIYSENQILTSSVTIYFETTKNTKTVQLMYWT